MEPPVPSSSTSNTLPLKPDHTEGPSENARLGIVISMFPELHETFILRELAALEKKGIDFVVYSLQLPRDPITLPDAKRLSEQRTEYSRLITISTLKAFFRTCVRHPLKLLQTIFALIRNSYDRPVDIFKALAILPITLHFGEQAKAQGISHLHGHWANIPTTACWYLQQIEGFTWSAAIHGEDIFSPNRFLPYKLDQATFTVVCSGYFCNHLQQRIGLQQPSRVHLNYHGLDPRVMKISGNRKFKPRQGQVFTIVSIGRLVPTKGHDTLLHACAELRSKLQAATNSTDVNLKLKLIGSGPQEESLKGLVENLSLGDVVEFVGGMAFDDVLATLQAADVFCLAPRLIPGHPPDGIPNVIAEAMALRIPVVTTRVSAIPELVEHEVSGLLVPVDDSATLAAELHRVAGDETLARRLSEQGFAKVERLFNQEQNINELLSLLDKYTSKTISPRSSENVCAVAAQDGQRAA